LLACTPVLISASLVSVKLSVPVRPIRPFGIPAAQVLDSKLSDFKPQLRNLGIAAAVAAWLFLMQGNLLVPGEGPTPLPAEVSKLRHRCCPPFSQTCCVIAYNDLRRRPSPASAPLWGMDRLWCDFKRFCNAAVPVVFCCWIIRSFESFACLFVFNLFSNLWFHLALFALVRPEI